MDASNINSKRFSLKHLIILIVIILIIACCGGIALYMTQTDTKNENYFGVQKLYEEHKALDKPEQMLNEYLLMISKDGNTNKNYSPKKRKEYYEKNKENEKLRWRKYYNNNSEKLKTSACEYYYKNRERYIENAVKRNMKKIKEDIAYRIRVNLGKRLHKIIKHTKKNTSMAKLIGCTINELRDHIQRQFKPGMSWENYGIHGWHVDHIIPCAAFDLTDPEQQKQCFHYTNLQPLWAKDNLSKGAKGA